jgi:hypothetical protein
MTLVAWTNEIKCRINSYISYLVSLSVSH